MAIISARNIRDSFHRRMRRRISVLLILAACPPATALGQPDQRAVPKADPVPVIAGAPLVKVGDFRMQEVRFGAAAVAEGDYLYVIGGSNQEGTPLDSIERIDLRTGRSEACGQLRTGRRWHGAVLYEGRIYVLGGFNRILPTPNYFEPSVEIIDLATRKVTLAAEMPVARIHFGCALVDGKIYAIGGVIQRGTNRYNTETTDVYDIATDKWAAGIPLPAPRQVVAAVDGGSIIVPGGYTGYIGQTAVAEVGLFNPKEQTWRSLPPLCEPVAAHAAAVLGHRLYLFGNDVPSEHVVTYDLQNNKSESRPLPFTPVRYPAAVEHDGRIYVVGGDLRGLAVLDTVQIYVLKKEP